VLCGCCRYVEKATYLLTYVRTWVVEKATKDDQATHSLTYLCTFVLTYLRTYLLTYLSTYVLTYVLTYLRAYLLHRYVEKATKDGVPKRVVDYGEAQPGDWGFDPLEEYTQSFPTKDMQLAEIKHGRAAMMGITGVAVQEALWGTPVVEQTPWLFGR